MYKIFDVTQWQRTEESASGSKDKEWRICPESLRYGLIKKPVSCLEEDRDPIKPHTGEAWSEKIASEIGKSIGIRTHDVEIAYVDEVYCSLCWRFLDPQVEILEEGADLIDPFDRTYDRKKLRGEEVNYNMNLLYRVFTELGMLHHLFDMIVFDALVGNTDRHQDNFGIITHLETAQIVFAPLYDNASCLGRELLIPDVQEKMTNPTSFEAYISRSPSLIRTGTAKRGTKHFNLLESILEGSFSKEMRIAMDKVEFLASREIEQIVHSVPSEVMHDEYKRFVIRLLTTRRDRLLQMR
ncbi:HipA domain-containing protein [Tumebacillus permanentifrigoris]|uniref:HipA-like protein n=1 Tax=Tumebacillus permanentifrigoris TaxID=378543 RepID=A0A316D7H8_9BACL|nr:HipA domain-containing protein [Tumebacillus permanentifrigoris]PWK08434.1 HipA-like protein [Tumebacillus permanentifrigoris]